MYLTVQPAYGRDYKSKKEVRAAWLAGKDFEICTLATFISPIRSGRYVNKEDAPRGATINVRYDRQRKVCVIPVQ